MPGTALLRGLTWHLIRLKFVRLGRRGDMARFLWTQKEDIGPSARVGHCLTYDDVRGTTLLFGGDALMGSKLGDSWTWDGEFWTQVADTGPSPRRDHAMAFDMPRGTILLFGGTG